MQFEDDEVLFDAPVKEKKKTLLEDLDSVSSVDEINSSLAPSAYLARQFAKDKKKKKDKEEYAERELSDTPTLETDADVSWLDTISNFKSDRKKKKKKRDFSGFEIDEDGNLIPATMNEKGKKKKGKHKKHKGPINYNKEFATEQALLKDMYARQAKFADNLQSKYDAMNNSKSSARGIGKFTTDLIEGLNSARNSQLSILKEQIALKGKIADLRIKEHKEFGEGADSGSDSSAYASAFVQELIRSGRKEALGVGEPFAYEPPVSMGDNPDNEDLSQQLYDIFDENNDGPTYADFEHRGVQVYVVVDNDGRYKFEARDMDGNTVDDYELPTKTEQGMSFNKTDMMARDTYGRTYPMIISDDPIE